jgi:hypothetical protein
MIKNGWSDQNIYGTKAEAERHCAKERRNGYLTKITKSYASGKFNGYEVWIKEKAGIKGGTSRRARAKYVWGR